MRGDRNAKLVDFETPHRLGVGVWLLALLHAFFVTQLSIFSYTLGAELKRQLHFDDVFIQLASNAVVSNLAPPLLLGAILLISCWKVQAQRGQVLRLDPFIVLFSIATFLFCHTVDALLARITRTQIFHEVRGLAGAWDVQPLYALSEIVPFLFFAVTVVSVSFSVSRGRFATPIRGIVVLWRRAGTWVILSVTAGVAYYLLRMSVAFAGTATQKLGMQMEGLIVILLAVTVLHAYLYLAFICSVLKVTMAVTRD